MSQPRLIITSSGTSLLSNHARGKADLSRLVRDTANRKVTDLSPDFKATLDQAIAEARSALFAGNEETARDLSAELNGLIAYLGHPLQSRPGCPDHHVLVCSDTYQGEAVARGLADWLEAKNLTVECVTIQDLSTGSLAVFRSALARLARDIGTLITGYRAKGYGVVFNLTGGFKPVSGFLQVLGNLQADECVSIFETSRELLRIPRLPVKPDESLADHFATLRRLAFGEALDAAACAGIPETLLMELDGKVLLSEYGEAFWPALKERRYAAELLPSLSNRVRFSKAFERDVTTLDPQRRLALNERLDDLARCIDSIDSNETVNLRSLRFKKMQTPLGSSTHEFYVWTGDDDRCFGRYDGSVFVVETLGAHR